MRKCLSIFLFLSLISSPLVGQNLNAEKIYEKYNDAVVRIFTYYSDNTIHGQASGVILKKEGWIVTNYHVFGDAAILYAEHNGKLIKLDSVVAADDKKDILILKFSLDENERKKIPDLKVANSDLLKVGQKIYAIGSPYGFENTITEGIISGLRTSMDSAQSYIQISAPISSGSSGGAVISSKGELVGISSMVYSGQTAQNLNFAIAINDFIEAAKNKKMVSIGYKKEDVNFYYQLGYSRFQAKAYATAIINFTKGLEFANVNDSGILLYYIGQSYLKLKQFDAALLYFNQSLEKVVVADTYVGLGDVYREKKDPDRALLYFAKAILTDSMYYGAYLGLGLVYYEQRNYEEALWNLKKAFDIDPKKPEAYYLLGHVCFALSEFDKAIGLYQKAIEWNPNYAEAYLALGNTYLKQGDTEKAIENQQIAYRLNPELRNGNGQ